MVFNNENNFPQGGHNLKTSLAFLANPVRVAGGFYFIAPTLMPLPHIGCFHHHFFQSQEKYTHSRKPHTFSADGYSWDYEVYEENFIKGKAIRLYIFIYF